MTALGSGQRLGPYEILAPLGAGGMGEVYRGRDPRLGRAVAIKVLAPDLAADPEALARFRREARAIAALSHPNILAIHDIGEHEGLVFAVMELLEGETLRDAIVAGPLPLRRAAEIAIAVAEGLAAAHSRGIVHRDVKPENVFLAAPGAVKLLDFGLARVLPLGDPENGSADRTLEATVPGVILGTVHYMSPEQARGEAVDERSDIFSLGSVLYEMLTGEKAFPGVTTPEVLASILRDEPAGLSQPDRIPSETARVLRHVLEKTRAARYQSASDLSFELRSLLSSPAHVGPAPAAPRDTGSLAILPFVNSSSDPELEYLSDGISESLMNALSQVPDLKVIARNSAFRYKGTTADPAAIARILGVRSIVTGRVLQRGDRLSVSVELVDARENRHLWGEQYHRRLADLFEIQEEISRDIAGKLRSRLAGPAGLGIKRYTEDVEAYRLYLRGRYYWNKRPQAEFSRALECYQQAIERDPTFALAFAGIADYYGSLGSWEFGGLPPREAFPLAKAAVERALALDDSIAEAHSAMGHLQLHYEWNDEASERSFARALALNPGYTNAHHYRSHLHLSCGRVAESLADSLRAIEMDPLDQILQAHLAWHYVFAREYDRAIEQCGRTQEMGDSFWPYFFRGFALEQKGDLVSALAEFGEAIRRSSSTFALTAAAHVHGLAGRRAEALAIRDELLGRRIVPAYDLAMIHLALSETEDAQTALEQALAERSTWMAYLGLDPRLDPLRGQPRFEEVVRRVGLAA